MKHSESPPHLPTLPSDRDAYEHLYRFSYGGDVFGVLDDWRERRIPVGLSAPEVYRRLPSAPDFEYGGYLTKTRIRFIRGTETEAYTDTSKTCTFHSHPTAYPTADMPSEKDVYSFLKCPHVRAITVGAEWIWVWDKSTQVLATVERLLEWEAHHMLRELRRLCDEDAEGIFDHYRILALEAIGIRRLTRAEADPESWRKTMLRHTGIETLLIPREGGAAA